MLIRDFPESLGGEVFASAWAGCGAAGFLLDSALSSGGLGRLSYAGHAPFLVLRAHGRNCELLHADGRVERREAEPLGVLRDLLARLSLPRGLLPGVDFVGGAVGWLGYELGAAWEKVPPCAADDLGLPDLEFGFYDAVAVHDPADGRVRLLAHGLAGRDPVALLDALEARLRAASDAAGQSTARGSAPCGAAASAVTSAPVSDMGPGGFKAGVRRIRDYIASGDVYQVNLAHRFECAMPCPPGELYRRLRRLSPAPFGVYLEFGDTSLLGVSPERFLSLRGREVLTRPIKGTRPRGRTAGEDLRLRAELETSAKDRAELLMITDLERNDLGRVCRVGSVRVPRLFSVEGHPTVWHLVSEVAGELDAGRDVFDLLRACFPGGSITGAPKVRAMQLIAELERHRRGPYTGAMGWLGFDGDADLNIAIRTLVCAGGRATYHVGGGITWGSDPDAEYEETLAKGRALDAALRGLSEGVAHTFRP